jgi:hypothetical protein
MNHTDPHLKNIYISKDSKYMCWKCPYKNNEKKFPLDSIKQVNLNCINSEDKNP